MKAAARPETYLRKVLALVGVTQAELARQLDTSRQQVSKWAADGRAISRDWAMRMEPILGVAWPCLVEGVLPPELEPGNEDNKLIHKQLLLLKEGWPLLSFDERRAILAAVDALTAPRRKSA